MKISTRLGMIQFNVVSSSFQPFQQLLLKIIFKLEEEEREDEIFKYGRHPVPLALMQSSTHTHTSVPFVQKVLFSSPPKGPTFFRGSLRWLRSS